MREDAADHPEGQSEFLAFFLAGHDVDVDVIGVFPLFLKRSVLPPEVSFVEAFTSSQMLGEIRIYIAADFLDLDNRALHRIPVREGKILQGVQKRHNVVDALIKKEESLIDAELGR